LSDVLAVSLGDSDDTGGDTLTGALGVRLSAGVDGGGVGGPEFVSVALGEGVTDGEGDASTSLRTASAALSIAA
jgi:hypothetical protein